MSQNSAHASRMEKMMMRIVKQFVGSSVIIVSFDVCAVLPVKEATVVGSITSVHKVTHHFTVLVVAS